MRKRVTIKFWLQSTAIGIFFILILLGAIVGYYVKIATDYYKVLATVNEIAFWELEIRKSEKTFIYEETINDNYYLSGKSEFLQNINDDKSKIKENIQKLHSNRFIKNNHLKSNLLTLDTNFTNYETILSRLVKLVTEVGFKDYGITGQMRGKIHEVESFIEQIPQSQDLQIHMLMLRRHEKDYLLRKDPKYISKFNSRIDLFLQYISTENKLNEQDKLKLKNLISDYKNYFNQITEHEKYIGLTDNMGLKNDLNIVVSDIETSIYFLKTEVEKQAETKIGQALMVLISIGLLLISFAVLLIFRLSKHITKSIEHVNKYITVLGMGQLPDYIYSKRNDEISDMTESLNVLIENLKNTQKFAIEVGMGKLDTTVNVFENKGDLGGSLIEMRNRLLQVSKEQERTRKEANRRAWISEGKAKIADILRNPEHDLNKFYFRLLTAIINYINANIGALYLISDIDDKQEIPDFELKAATSYNRNDANIFEQANVEKNSYIYRCIKELEVVNIKNVSKSYMKLSSGIVECQITNIVVVPLTLRAANRVLGVLEVGAIKEQKSYKTEFLKNISNDIAITVSNIMSSQKTEKLLQQTKEQAEILFERQEEIESQKKLLEDTNEMLEIQKENTAGSIRYAQSIQTAILPHRKYFEDYFRRFFIIFKPKDIVSGDFYWLADVEHENKKMRFVALVDCTGHGVPGAFMSLIGSMILNEIVKTNKITDPKLILELLNARIITSLRQDETNEFGRSNNDGMDIALISITKNKVDYDIVFSGGKINMYYYKKEENESEVLKLKADRKSIGGGRKKFTTDFTNKEINLKSRDRIYIFSDGIIDQNNKERRKFSSKRTIQIINKTLGIDLFRQKKILENELKKHQGNEPQRDDISMVALELK